MIESPARPTPSPATAGEPDGARGSAEAAISRRVEGLPVEVGVLLMVAGVTTGMLPPPPGPFDLAIIASGGLVLWPRGFRAIDGWTQNRFPWAHRATLSFLGRLLDDLERRYPGSPGCHPSSRHTAPTDP
jgi:hypothetical protein